MVDKINIQKREIVEEMRKSYLEYAMSVIVARALPDVRDGLKPVHRRILYSMHEMGLRPGAKYQKSAKVTGFCMGNFHPHGDAAIYDSLTRMAQDFSLRYPLIDGQGNFGCFTADTKVKLADGRNLSFKEMTEEHRNNKKLWGFTFNPNSKKIELAEIKNPHLTRKRSVIVEVAIDNGSKIRCTPDHKFMLRSGEYEKACDLKKGDSLMPAYFNVEQIKAKSKRLCYLSILQPFSSHYEFVHKLADEWNVRNESARKPNSSFILHHKNFNRWDNTPENIVRVTWEEHYKIHRDQSKNLWKEKGHLFREKHKQSVKLALSSLEVRRKLSENTKRLWLDPKYRSKYSQTHFRDAALLLWQKEGIRELHSNKAKKQWENPNFRKALIAGISARSKKRLEENPNFMKALAQKAVESLKYRWKDPEYKERVIKSKILGYVKKIVERDGDFNEVVYQNNRTNNCIPNFTKAKNYFSSVDEMINKAKLYNHKVLSIKTLPHREDVYDITVEPWHNFLLDAGIFVHNSIDNDPAAAQRYTECRMTKITEELLTDIDKETVNYQDNYDGSVKEPTVLPSRIPNLLINGSMGIAVGMATNIPPHNLSEVLDASIYLIDNKDADIGELTQFVKGPDFPTGGVIYNERDIVNAYATGRGPVVMRGVAEIVEGKSARSGGFQIIVTEIPYQVNKAELIMKIADLVKEKKIEGIKDIRDESDKEGLRIAIDLKQDAFPRKVLNQLFKYTELQKAFHFNILGLVDGIQPQILGLKQLLEKFIEHRREVVTRRSRFELQRAKDRAHILEGLKKALDHIDAVIKVIKSSDSKEDAFNNLIKKFKFSDKQANAILEMKLQALAGLERKKIDDELGEKRKLIAHLEDLLASPKKILGVIKDELKEIKEKYGDERRTKVVKSPLREIGEEELMPEEDALFMLTRDGYIKRMLPENIRAQKRGGKGLVGIATKEEDVVSQFFLANTHDNLLFFTNSGKVFQTKGYEVPEASRQAKGKAIVNFLQVAPSDTITAVVPIPKDQKGSYLFMITANGIVKKVDMDAFSQVRRSGMVAIKLKGDDQLRWVLETSGNDQVILVTSGGNAIRFKEKDVRPMGRAASGVIGVRIDKSEKVVGSDVVPSGVEGGLKILVVMENGYGKRTDLKFYKVQNRGGRGVMTAKVTAKTGKVVSAHVTSEESKELVAVSRKGQVIRTSIDSVSVLGRATQGVRIMKLETGDGLASVAIV